MARDETGEKGAELEDAKDHSETKEHWVSFCKTFLGMAKMLEACMERGCPTLWMTVSLDLPKQKG